MQDVQIKRDNNKSKSPNTRSLKDPPNNMKKRFGSIMKNPVLD